MKSTVVKVRGFGDRQQSQAVTTQAKIAAYLEITPMTYEKLQNVSGIHRNSLRNRLDESTANGLIIRHKYSLPKNDLYYSNTYQHHLCKDLPNCLYYYLLNLWNEDMRELLRLHYIADKLDSKIEVIKRIRERTTDKKALENLDSQFKNLLIRRLHISPPQSVLDKIKATTAKLTNINADSQHKIDYYIPLEQQRRELEL